MSDVAPLRGFSARLAKLPLPLLTLYAAVCAFCVYFGMYAFRKPFDATTFKVEVLNIQVNKDGADYHLEGTMENGKPVNINIEIFAEGKTIRATSVDTLAEPHQKAVENILNSDLVYLFFFGTSIRLKTACVIAQIIGYMTSKYLGTKICSEVRSEYRALLMIGLILWAEAALLIFAVLPPNLKPLGMFLNGLPLGMVWGLCVRYLEGRRTSELMVAGLSCSYIIAGAVTRDVGLGLVIREWGFQEQWMPVMTGLLFLGPFLIALFFLNQMPPPSEADIAKRSVRKSMDAKQRKAFLKHFGWGLILLLAAYFFLTAFRDFRDHYGKEIFDQLKLGDQRAIFSNTEKWAFLGVILTLGCLNAVRSHRWALIAVYCVIGTGFAILGLATLAFQFQLISGYTWMVCLGIGLYLAYVPYGAVLFERMMAASRFLGTAVFAIQLADAIGYTGSVLLQILRDVVFGKFNYVVFTETFAYVVSIAGVTFMALSGVITVQRVNKPHDHMHQD
jgi:hypothetical protein